MRKFFFSFMLVLFVALFFEVVGAALLKKYPHIELSRELLAGKQQLDAGLNSIPQAFLLYIPRPNFSSDGYAQHNAHGYRGPQIPLHRKPHTLRVLFMGGSTTYGEGVKNPADSYPAQLGKLLERDPLLQGMQVEVINAGLRGGTSAEILTHYLLKYRYYRPDIVVLNPGGNDPVAYFVPTYHPDYSNMRKSPEEIRPLRSQSRWMLHSRFLSSVIVMLFFPDLSQFTSVVTPLDELENIPAKWFVPQRSGELQRNEVAFYNNMSTIVSEIKRDGANVLLLSYQGNPFDQQDQSFWRESYDYEENLLKIVGEEQGVSFASFPLGSMPKDMWFDASHLNEQGEVVKAAYVYQHLGAELRAWRSSLSDAGQSPAALKSSVVDPVLPTALYQPRFNSFFNP